MIEGDEQTGSSKVSYAGGFYAAGSGSIFHRRGRYLFEGYRNEGRVIPTVSLPDLAWWWFSAVCGLKLPILHKKPHFGVIYIPKSNKHLR